jgi:hypothetical protein
VAELLKGERALTGIARPKPSSAVVLARGDANAVDDPANAIAAPDLATPLDAVEA